MPGVIRRFPGSLLLACVGLSGCYLSYPFVDEELDGSRRDSGPVVSSDAGAYLRDGGVLPLVDAGVPPPPIDSGPGPGFDAGLPPRRDAGPPPPDAGPPPPPRDAGPPPPPPDAGPGTDAGRRSVALSFGAYEQLVVASAPSLDLTHAFTFEMWIRLNASSDAGFLCRKGDPAGHRYMYGVRVEGGAISVGWGVESGVVHEVGAMLPAGEWHHIAFVAIERGADAELTLYVDATPVGSLSAPNDLASAVNGFPLVFGRGGVSFDLDDVRMWSLARDPASIAASYRSRIDPGLAGLEMYLPLEEAGQLALDRTLHGHEAVLGRLTVADDWDPSWIADGAL